MHALVVSLLALSSIAHAVDVDVRGTHGAFAIEATFRDDPAAGDIKARGVTPERFRFRYDPAALTGSIEHRYLRTIFGKRPFTLTEDDVILRGSRRVSADADGTTGEYLVLAPKDYRVLSGYHAIGIEMGEDGRPTERANVVIFQGDLSRLQAILQSLIVGRHRYYLRPLITCESELRLEPGVGERTLAAEAASVATRPDRGG